MIELNVKLEFVPMQVLLFGKHTWCRNRCGGGSESQRKCAWAKFKELSLILTARGAYNHIKGKIYRAYIELMSRVYCRVGKFLPERKKPVAKTATGNNRHGKELVAKIAKTGKNH